MDLRLSGRTALAREGASAIVDGRSEATTRAVAEQFGGGALGRG